MTIHDVLLIIPSLLVGGCFGYFLRIVLDRMAEKNDYDV